MVSIKTQRVLSLLPLLNATVLFIWLYNYRVSVNKTSIFLKSLLVLLISTIPMVCVQVLCLWLFADSQITINIINALAIYLIPFAMARGLILFQIMVIKE